jgi:hypothetical protein
MAKQKPATENEQKQTLAERAGLKRVWVAGDPEPPDLAEQSLETLQTMLDHAIETVGPDSEAARRIGQALLHKADGDGAAVASNCKAGPACRMITIEIPIMDPPAHAPYRRNHDLHVEYGLDAARSEALRHIFAGLDSSDSRLASGYRPRAVSSSFLWLLDQVVAQIPAAAALVRPQRFSE